MREPRGVSDGIEDERMDRGASGCGGVRPMTTPAAVAARAADAAACGYLLEAAQDLHAVSPRLARACGARAVRRVSRALGKKPHARRQADALPVLAAVCGACGTYFAPPKTAELVLGDARIKALTTAAPTVVDLLAKMDADYTGTAYAVRCLHCGAVTVSAVQHRKGVRRDEGTEKTSAAVAAVPPTQPAAPKAVGREKKRPAKQVPKAVPKAAGKRPPAATAAQQPPPKRVKRNAPAAPPKQQASFQSFLSDL
eukprot:TRINITY_DN8060_c0_g1_i1.p2 TRINITY_DN8060_c0_g1~~TRINITY_DN8060_c0_g1_i1.p2  ORF type:complete len:254 (+),score=55.75 TRINITY_DN8060_c0_g1_i1:68-829(+)